MTGGSNQTLRRASKCTRIPEPRHISQISQRLCPIFCSSLSHFNHFPGWDGILILSKLSAVGRGWEVSCLLWLCSLRLIGIGALHQGKQAQQTSPSKARGNPVQSSKLLSWTLWRHLINTNEAWSMNLSCGHYPNVKLMIAILMCTTSILVLQKGWVREKGLHPWLQNRLSQPSQIGEVFHKTGTKHICMFPKTDILSLLKALNHSGTMTFEDYVTVTVTSQHLMLNY